MRYKIKDIAAEGLSVHEPYPAELLKEALEGTEADLSASSARAELTLQRNHDEVLALGRIKGSVTLPCGACLEPTRVEVEAPVHALFGPEEPAAAEEGEEDLLSQADFFEHDGIFVELAPLLRELLILALPMSPRCREDCRGLCPTCGEDRNKVECGHGGGDRPSAFSALKDLKL